MKNIIYIEVYKGDNQYVAEGLNLSVVTQGKTLDELMVNLQEAVSLHLADESPESLGFSEQPQVLVNLELPSQIYA